MKHRFITLMLLLLGSTFAAEANPVDMKTAREIGLKFLNANTKAPLRNADELQWVTTYNTNRGEAAFYVFNTQDGFVIVSADDCATPILGYSSEGHFDTENIPIQLQEYLQGFVEQIGYGIENHLQADKRTAEQWERVRTNGQLTNNRTDEVVEPLLTTKWNQGCYYNALCPENEAGPCGHVYAGCVATAMAQIMDYWRWPEQGTGEHSYQWNGQTLSANFGETTYDWDNMLDEYYYNNTEYTQEQIEAISTLMYHCGVAVNMQYSANGSGAYDDDAFYALMGYFNYSDEMNYEGSLYFIDVTWKAKLKDCLDLRRPIFYSGQPTQGSPNDQGHAFVCDGYDSNELFHFNWGWGGSCDGYFAIGALNPGDYYDFNFLNCAIFNIHPQGEAMNYVINATSNDSIRGTVSGGGSFAHGATVTLSATANDGYCFCWWEENGGIVSTDQNYSFTVNYNRNLVAIFAEPFTMTVAAMGGGTVSGEGSICYGESSTVNATPDEGYYFAYWTEDDEIVSYEDNYTFIALSDRNLTATFVDFEVFYFADANTRSICLANWDTNGDDIMSYAEVAAVTSLGEVFRGNVSLTSFEELEFFTGLTSINNYAFYGCTGLTGRLNLPNCITSIGNSAFEGCSGFSGNLVIPNSVTSIGNRAFMDCTGFYYDTLTIGNSVNTIGNSAFEGCSGFTGDLVIPNSVISIGDRAFYGFSRNTNCGLTIGISVTTIGSSAFAGWNHYADVHYNATNCADVSKSSQPFRDLHGDLFIGDGVERIPDYMFYNFNIDSPFYTLIIPNSVTTIGKSAFENSIGFAQIYYNAIHCADVTSSSQPFKGCKGSLIIGNEVENIPANMFYNSNFTGSLTIPNSVTTIGEGAFYWCNGFTGSLTIPNSVTTIGDFAFRGCSGFTGDLTIGDSVIEIGYSAFNGCSGFTGNLTIPSSMTTIKNATFQDCCNLTSAVIGNSVTELSYEAFYGCSGLNSITVLAETPPSFMTTTFYDVNSSAIVKVPCGCLEAYKATAWNDYFTSIIQNCIGISEDSEDSENVASIYPNPTNGQMKIEVESIEYITISNELGQVIYEGKASGNTFEYDFSRHEAGAYLIMIETENGIITKRVFVTR